MKKVLFVCIENSCRSQIAEAFAKIHGKGVLEPYSSGSRPSGVVNPKGIASMKEIGYDMSTHRSKPLTEFEGMEFDYVITMGCGMSVLLSRQNTVRTGASPTRRTWMKRGSGG